VPVSTNVGGSSRLLLKVQYRKIPFLIVRYDNAAAPTKIGTLCNVVVIDMQRETSTNGVCNMNKRA
jgi:hypothetical protein